MRGTQASRDRGLSEKVQLLLLLGIGMVVGNILSGLLTTPASLYAQSTSPLTIQPETGRVGIGTTNPGAQLHVQGDGQVLNIGDNSGTSARYAAFDTGASGGVFVGIDSSAGGVVFSGTAPNSGSIGTTGAFPFQIATQNSVKVTVDASGNVGIGTTAPSHTLHVQGQIRATAGTGIYEKPLVCGGGLSTATTSTTIGCGTVGDGSTPIYYQCSGSCPAWNPNPETCTNTLLGRLVAP